MKFSITLVVNGMLPGFRYPISLSSTLKISVNLLFSSQKVKNGCISTKWEIHDCILIKEV